MDQNNKNPKANTIVNKLQLIIENEKFDWNNQYITGTEVKGLINAPLDSELYLSTKGPLADEAISNETKVDLERPGIERFYFKNLFDFTLNNERYRSFKAAINGEEVLKAAGIVETKCYTLYQKLQGCDFEKIGFEDDVDLSNPGIEKFITKDADTFTYTVDGEHELTEQKILSANQILRLANIDIKTHYLILESIGGDSHFAWNPEELITMDCKRLVFKSKKWLDVVNIEEFGKECESVPPSRKYQLKLDKQYHTVESRFVTREELINLGGKPEVKYDVYKFKSGSPKPIKLAVGEKVDLTEDCLIRFVLQPKEQTEGKGNRQQFSVPEDDLETLERLNLPWEAITSGNHWVVIYDYPIPVGYNVQKADVALMIPPTYPVSQIDMAYFNPPLAKLNGRPIGALANQPIDGKTFQRWSRHRGANEWTPGVDCIATHLCLVDNWLINDLNK